MSVQIEKFVKSKEVTGMNQSISKEGRIETDEEVKVAIAYALSRAGRHKYSKISKANERINGEIKKM